MAWVVAIDPARVLVAARREWVSGARLLAARCRPSDVFQLPLADELLYLGLA
jgi:hypothetical protein